MKYLYIVLDGAGDSTYTELGDKSPLGYSKMPFLNSITLKSKLGSVEVVGKNIPPESDSAVLSLLGYDIKKFYPGRGVIEALGAGIKMEKDTIYFRANFATIDENWCLLDTRAGRITGELNKKLSNSISKIVIDGVIFTFISTVGHRGIVCMKGRGLSDNVTGNHNGYSEIKGLKIGEALMIKLPMKLKQFSPRDSTNAAKRSAELLNKYVKRVHELLQNNPLNKGLNLPANMLLLRGASKAFKPLISMKHLTKLDWAALIEMPVEEGICKLAGIKTILVGKESDSLIVKTRKYAALTLANIKKYDALYIHLKGPDIPSHDGRLLDKIKTLELIDQEFFKPVFEKLDLSNTSIIVTSDHSTECRIKAHSSRPTPLLVYSPIKKGDNLMPFDETTCKVGSLGLIKGKDVIKKLIKL